MSRLAARFALGLFLFVATLFGGATSAGALTLDGTDLDFILEQVKRAEAHAAGGSLLGPGPNQVGDVTLPYGLRTVDGTFNNLIPGQELFGSADRLMPRLGGPPIFSSAHEPFDPDGPGPAPASNNAYSSTSGVVSDSEPRTISNLIVDQSGRNPAAVAAAERNPGAVAPADLNDPKGSFYLPNQAPDVGLSAPYNSWFTLFGQFFDHGLDLTTKGGSGTVIVPLKADDPLYEPGSHTNFMVLTRATNQAGPDTILGTADDIRQHVNTTTPFVDQNQTYTSHPSHQVFLREYELNAAGKPVSTGKLLEHDPDPSVAGDEGLATWADVKAQASQMLGIALDDQDLLNVPLLKTDQYGRFIPNPTAGPTQGFPQLVTNRNPLTFASGTPGAPVNATLAVRTKHAFLDDIAHHAVPFGNHDQNSPTGGSDTPNQALTPDTDPGVDDDNDPATYDDEMLDAHFITGDGRGNENIGLTTMHQIFHTEHNMRVDDIKALIAEPGGPVEADWRLADGSWNGERLFQAARFATEMQYQHLVFEEFARKVQPEVNLFAGYETDIDPAITAEFAHAAYRFGHSMLTEEVARTNADGSSNDIGLIDAFLNPQAFTDGGSAGTLTAKQAAASVARGMTAQRGNELDEFVTGALRNNLVGLPLDLATINIARGRDAGVPPLNALRRTFYEGTGNSALEPYENWTDFGLGIRNPESLVNFVAAYGTHPTIISETTTDGKRAAAELIVNGDPAAANVPDDSVEFLESTPGSAWASDAEGVTNTGLDQIDLWIGGLAEKQMPFGGLLGSTFNFIFETQMEKLQDADRLYYLTRTAGLNFLTELEGNSFAALIERTTGATHLPADVFSSPDYSFELKNLGTSGPVLNDPATPYNETQLLTRSANGTIRFAGAEHVLFGGTIGADKIQSSEGDDTFWADEGNDRLEGGAGNDLINGGSGDDTITDEFGIDNIKGNAGDDVISGGQGTGDLLLDGPGDDFSIGGSDPTETFGGPGDDFIFAGDSADTVFANEGADWIEGGGQADLLQGDNGAPFQDGRSGDDVIIGQGGNDDYDAEGGDDIMVAGPGTTRSEGMIGFDWVTHRGDPQAADADLNRLGLLPPDIDTIRDRFDLVEGLSGWDKNDVLRGDDRVSADIAGDDELTARGVGLIEGLAPLLGGASTYNAGNIITGGLGSDTIEGRGGNDIIDGDAWLDVQISVRDQANPATELFRVNAMNEIQARLISGVIKPSQLEIVRTMRRPAGGAATDTAVFSDDAANYDIEPNLNSTEMTITHVGGTALNGSDTVRNIERLRFADGPIDITGTNQAATGTVTVSDTSPTEDQLLTATGAFQDAQGVRASSIVYSWQLETRPGVWEDIGGLTGIGPSFTPTDAEVGARLRVRADFEDNAGVSELVNSAPTDAVINVNDDPQGQPTLSDTTPDQGQPITASITSIADADGLETAVFGYRWQQSNGAGGFNNIAGPAGAGQSFTPAQAQVDRSLRVQVTYTDDQGTTEQLLSAASAPVANVNDPPQGRPVLSDTTPTQGQTISANPNQITDADGLAGVVFAYRWQQGDGAGGFNNVAGPAGAGQSFTPGQAQVGLPLRVRVTYTDNRGAAEQVFSLDSAAVANVNDPPVGRPTLSDTTPARNQLITASTASISDADGLAGVVFSYRWQQEIGGAFDNINGAQGAGQSFTPGQNQVGRRIRVRVTYTDNQGTAEAVLSDPSAPVAPAGAGIAPPAGGDALRVSDLSVPATVSAERAAPFKVAATVPEGASVLEIRVLRQSRGKGKATGKPKLIGTAVKNTPEAKRYEFRLRDNKQLRNPKPGRYLVEVRTGAGMKQLGEPEVETLTVKKAKH